MRTSRIRQLTTAGVLALIVGAPLAGCGAEALTPLPVDAGTTPPTVTASQAPDVRPSSPAATDSSPPGTARPAAPKPVRTTSRPHPTPSSSTCYGAVRHDIDLQNTVLDLQKSMCFHTGGVLRLKGIGPGLVTATPESLVSRSYEAGVVDLRFVREGTVTVTIPQDDKTYTITVVVRR